MKKEDIVKKIIIIVISICLGLFFTKMTDSSANIIRTADDIYYAQTNIGLKVIYGIIFTGYSISSYMTVSFIKSKIEKNKKSVMYIITAVILFIISFVLNTIKSF